MARPKRIIGKLVDLALAIHALRMSIDANASRAEIVRHAELINLRFNETVDEVGRETFARSFRRWIDETKKRQLKLVL